MPFLTRQKAEFGIGIGKIQDLYFQNNVIDFNNDKNDISNYTIFGGSVAMDGNTLNSRQYATAGRRERLVAHIYTGTESYEAGSTPDPYNVHIIMSSPGCNYPMKWNDIIRFPPNSYWGTIFAPTILHVISAIIIPQP